MRIVVDDALLFAVISEQPDVRYAPYREAAACHEVFTTSSWLWRLSRAVAHGDGGALSAPFQRLADDEQGRVRSALTNLPAGIGIVDARTLVPVMVAISRQLNFLTAEAVATAIVTEAKIVVTTQSKLLTTTAEAVGVEVELMEFLK